MSGSRTAAPSFRLADGVVLGFAAELVLLPTGLVTAAVLTRTLGPADYGLFSIVATFVSWLGLTTTTLIARASVKFVSEAPEWRPVATSVLRWRLAIGALSLALVMATADVVASALHAAELAPYLRVFAIDLLLVNVARAYRDVLTGRGRFREVAAVSLARWISRLVLIVSFVAITGSVMAAVLGSIGATLVELLVARHLQPLPLRGPSSVPRSRMWTVAAPLFVYGATMQLYAKVDLFALSALGGTSRDVGFYAAAQNLAVAPGLFAMAIGPLLLATLARLRSTGNEPEARSVGRTALRVTIALVPLAALVAGAADEIVRVIFGATFVSAGPLLAMLFGAAVALAVMAVAVAIITAADHQRFVSSLGIGVLATAIVGHLVLVPRLGAVGAAAVTTGAGAVGGLVAMALVHRLWQVQVVATVLRASLIAIPAYWLADTLHTPGVFALTLKLVMISLAVLAAFVALGELDADERRRWRETRFFRRLARVAGQ